MSAWPNSSHGKSLHRDLSMTPPRPTTPFFAALRELVSLSLPIAGVQVGLMFMGVVETLFVGHVSAVALAAVALGHLYFFTVLGFGLGLLFTLDPLVSQGIGVGVEEQVTLAIQT